MPHAFLIVEDDPLTARSLARRLGCLGKTTVAATLAAGRAACRVGPDAGASRWSGAIVDVNLPDGSGIELAVELRSLDPPVPTLVLTGQVDREVINEAQVVGAEFALKPPDEASLIAFASRALASPGPEHSDDRALLTRTVRRYSLTARETAVLAQALLGVDRDVSARALGMSEGTIKTHIAAILRKTGEQTMRAVVGVLRKEPVTEWGRAARQGKGR